VALLSTFSEDFFQVPGCPHVMSLAKNKVKYELHIGQDLWLELFHITAAIGHDVTQ